jgi:hypothetical protein
MMLRALGVGMLLVGVVVGCSNGNSTGGQPSNNPTSGGSPTSVPEVASCQESLACSCDTGVSGVTRCDTSGQKSCDCSKCPYDPTAGEMPFVACGGTPFGSWQLTEFDVSAYDGGNLKVVNNFLYANSSCNNEATPSKDAEMRLILLDGGQGSVSIKNEAVAYKVAESCLISTVQGSCDGFEQCQSDDCGLCSCKTSVADTQGDIHWTTTNNVLSFASRDFGYCVDGDKLSLQAYGSHEIFRLERVYMVGRPLECEYRTADQCLLGGDCHVGACSCPVYPNEGDCTNHVGCTWDNTPCRGAAAGCGISDYGVVPGCVVSKTPQCTGSSACEMIATDQCEQFADCKLPAP